mgnify:CR=1 FL=1
MNQYGPLAAGIAIAGCLVAAFSTLILKMFGSATAWSAMAAFKSSRVPMLAARVLGVVAIAATYVYLTPSNVHYFFALAAALAIAAVVAVMIFNRLKEIHVLQVPVVTRTGAQAVDNRGRPVSTPILIGQEEKMQAAAQEQLRRTREERGGVSLRDFVAGYAIYQPDRIWTREQLSAIANRLMSLLIVIYFGGALALFVAALAVVQKTS